MDPVKTGTAQPVKAPDAPKRSDQKAKPEVKPETVSAKKAPEQAPQPTINTSGETVGRLLHAVA